MTRLLPGLAAFVAATLVALLGLYAEAGTPKPRKKELRRGVVQLRLLGVNDFHGHLEPPRPGIGVRGPTGQARPTPCRYRR